MVNITTNSGARFLNIYDVLITYNTLKHIYNNG